MRTTKQTAVDQAAQAAGRMAKCNFQMRKPGSSRTPGESLGQCPVVTATKLRVASRGLCLSIFCLPWGGVVISQAPIHPLLPSTGLSSFFSYLLGTVMGLPSWGWVFKGERQDSPPAKQMTLRLQGLSFALFPSKILYPILYL